MAEVLFFAIILFSISLVHFVDCLMSSHSVLGQLRIQAGILVVKLFLSWYLNGLSVPGDVDLGRTAGRHWAVMRLKVSALRHVIIKPWQMWIPSYRSDTMRTMHHASSYGRLLGVVSFLLMSL